MYLEVQNQRCYIDTGREVFDPQKPCILFIHGSGLDHHFWTPMANWFASNGFSVMVPDLPGHSLSSGNAFKSIEQSAVWLNALIEKSGINQTHLVGHSQGFLSALELSTLAPDKILSLTGIASAAAIPVNPALIETAQASARTAAGLMLKWGMGKNPRIIRGQTIGLLPIAIAREIMSRNPLATDLETCTRYLRGAEIAQTIKQPCLLILSEQDKMTRLSDGQKLAESLSAKTVILQQHGHMLPMEAPDQCIQQLHSFINNLKSERRINGN